MAELILTGLHRAPLAQYLGALGLLRLVSEQVDPSARGYWTEGGFALDSGLDDEDALLAFILRDYRPTPVAGPWNGGSGFYPKDNTEALDAILASEDERFADYRKLLTCVRSVLDELDLHGKPEKKAKAALLHELRAELPDAALPWLDAALVLTNEGERYPPLLGTGGNDGRLEFSNNFMKRLAELLLGQGPSDPKLLRAYLFGEPAPGMVKVPIGQFMPAQAGGANAVAGYASDAQINPWTYVFAVEGAMVPSGAATRRLESNRGGTPAFPFTVRAAMVGYASASDEDSRDELWMPVWTAPASFAEIRRLFAEGRAKVPTGRRHRREAVDGLDFARAIATLGVDRGIRSFTRFGLHQRNGLSYFAVPLGEWYVRQHRAADLLAEIDPWLRRLRMRANSGKLPGSLTRAARRVEAQLLEACRRDDSSAALDLLIALGQVELLAGRGKERLLDPLPALDPQWLNLIEDGSAELSLAASLASAGIRRRCSPVSPGRGRRWMWVEGDEQVTWVPSRDLEGNLIALLQRREIEAAQSVSSTDRFPDAAASGIVDAQKLGAPRRWAQLGELADFIDGRLYNRRLEQLVHGLMLINWAEVPRVHAATDRLDSPLVPASFGLLALARELELDPPLPRTPGLLAQAAAGSMERASALAVRRLAGAGRRFCRAALSEPRKRTRRIAAALAFPLASSQLQALERQLFPLHATHKDAPA